jgi:hypothetical protein
MKSLLPKPTQLKRRTEGTSLSIMQKLESTEVEPGKLGPELQ